MKNVINYYYQINIENIHLANGTYYFEYSGNSYMFKEYKRDISELEYIYILSNEVLKNNYFHKIIKNKDNMLFTIVDSKCYVLLKLSNVINDKISIYDINFIKINNISIVSKLNFSNWIELWMRKIDYLEYKMEHVENKDNLLMPYFHFFIGLGENAIRYIYDTLEEYQNINNSIGICHRRLSSNMSVSDYYDPLELIVDYRVRDVAEYIKSMFFNDNIDLDLIDEYISGSNFKDYEFSLLMGRILFPTYFFDMLDKSLDILKINISKYISYLSDIYFIIKKRSNIREIRWLIKKM